MNSFTGIFQGFYLDFTPFYFEEPLCSQQLVENPDEYQKLPRIWWFRVSCLFKLAVQSWSSWTYRLNKTSETTCRNNAIIQIYIYTSAVKWLYIKLMLMDSIETKRWGDAAPRFLLKLTFDQLTIIWKR